MSISGILSSSFLQKQLGAHSTPYQQSVEQLSKDLQSGNLSAAQSDFATLQKAFSPSPISTATASATSTSNLVAQPSTSSPAISIPATFPPLKKISPPSNRIWRAWAVPAQPTASTITTVSAPEAET